MHSLHSQLSFGACCIRLYTYQREFAMLIVLLKCRLFRLDRSDLSLFQGEKDYINARFRCVCACVAHYVSRPRTQLYDCGFINFKLILKDKLFARWSSTEVCAFSLNFNRLYARCVFRSRNLLHYFLFFSFAQTFKNIKRNFW